MARAIWIDTPRSLAANTPAPGAQGIVVEGDTMDVGIFKVNAVAWRAWLDQSNMIRKLIAMLALALVTSGCAGNGGGIWGRGVNPDNGGPPPSLPCQATG